MAWLSLAVQYQGQPLEQAPRSVLGYFFATYWEGTPQQCGADAAVAVPAAADSAGALQAPGGSSMVSLSAVDSSDSASAAGAAAPPPGGCTLCCFPAAAVAAHAIFTVAFLAALWVTCSRLADAVLNNRLKRRMRLFQLAHSLLAVGGEFGVCEGVTGGGVGWGGWAAWVCCALQGSSGHAADQHVAEGVLHMAVCATEASHGRMCWLLAAGVCAVHATDDPDPPAAGLTAAAAPPAAHLPSCRRGSTGREHC